MLRITYFAQRAYFLLDSFCHKRAPTVDQVPNVKLTSAKPLIFSVWVLTHITTCTTTTLPQLTKHVYFPSITQFSDSLGSGVKLSAFLMLQIRISVIFHYLFFPLKGVLQRNLRVSDS